MKAIGYRNAGSIDRPGSLQSIDLPRPVASGHDVLVEVEAISVNPVDTKLRQGVSPSPGEWRVLGWDAVGRVAEVGEQVTSLKAGDAVYYAGSIARPGANSQFHLVDERIVGRKPKTLTCAEAAALPLTAITAWEMLFDRLDIQRPVIAELIAPQGRFGLIDDPKALSILPFKRKSVSIHWELMFTRSTFQTPDMDQQARLLNEVARLVDEGKVRTTLNQVLRPIDPANLKQAHTLIESGRSKGKIVLEGFDGMKVRHEPG